VEFKVLGPIEVWDGERSVDVGARMPRAVLALLLMDAGRVVSVDRLVDQLWGEQPPATATTALQGYISQLRRALEPDRPARTPPQLLVTRPPGYMLRAGPETLDAARFEALAAEGRELLAAGRPGPAREVLRPALALWRGMPYAELAFEPFVQAEVARLNELRDGAVEVLAEADLAVGEHSGAVAELERLVAAEPLRERRWELLAVALYRCGRQAEALRALDKARRTLGEELGIVPGQSLRQLEAAVLAQSPSLDWAPGPPSRPSADHPASSWAAPPAAPPAPEPGSAVAAPAPADRPPLVGRDRELDELLAALDAACRSRGRLVLVSGEPGIGKTRLVEELAERAAGRDVHVAWGRCHDGEVVPAYWPWSQIIRSLAEGHEPSTVRAALGAGVAEVAQMVPEIKEVVGAAAASLPLLEPEAARARLYDAVVGFVLRLAHERPLLVIVDDLHSADLPSLQLVRLLAAQLAGARILLVCTYREREAADTVVPVLADLARVPNIGRVTPGRLDDDDVARLVAAATGTAPAAEVVEAILSRTEGNPFFVWELVRLLGAERRLAGAGLAGGEIPAGVRDVVRLRLARLPRDTVALLGVAAVIGREFDLDVLIPAAALDDERALELVEAALLAGVVTEDPGAIGRYRFANGLVRETVYEELSSVRRPLLHRKVAEVLERLGTGDDARVFAIARHLAAAAPLGEAERAFEWSLKAADRATARLAFEEAEDHLRRALMLLDRIPAGAGKTRRELTAQVQLGALLFMTRGYSEPAVGDAWSRARRLCREVPDAPELLPTLWGLWAFTCVRADFPTALDLSGELLEHGRRGENTLFAVIGHETMGITCWHQGRLGEAREHLEEGARLCDTLPGELFTGVLLEKHPGVACRSFAGVVLWLLGEHEAATKMADEGLALARRLAHPFSIVFALFFGAWQRVLLGDRAGVVARADEAIALARRHGFRQYVAMLGVLRGWATDDAPALERAFSDFLDTGSRMLQHFFLGLLADVQRRTGQRDDGLASVERALGEAEAVGERFWEAELHRLRAELGGPGADDALSQALMVARSQGARALEARVAETLAQR
jgi:DNA-binding SARP family transcriptional activator